MEVFLYKDGDILSRGTVLYIGLLGMQVDANPLLFPKFSRLDVVLYLETENGTRRCKLHAVVTTRSPKGVGLTFVKVDTYTQEKLSGILDYMDNTHKQHAIPILS